MKTHFAHSAALAAVLALGVSSGASASFAGSYAVANWITADNAGGSVDASAAPDTITLSSGNAGDPSTETPAPGDTSFTIAAPAPGRVSFDWSYHTNDIYGFAAFDPFGYVVNGQVTVLPDQSLAPAAASIADPTGTAQAGSAVFFVNAGDVFGFNANTFDGLNGASVATVSNFSVSAVPVPAAVWLLASALAGLGVFGRRKPA